MKACFALVASFCVLFVPVEGVPPFKTELAKLQGRWQAGVIDNFDQRLPADLARWVRVTIANGHVYFTRSDEVPSAAIKINPALNPKHIDLLLNDGEEKGKVLKGLYALDGDTLKLAFSEQPEDRPRELKADARARVALVMLARVKE